MALFKTSNPALGQNTFSDAARSQYGGDLVDASTRMTLSGTVNKTGILLLCAIVTAAWTWNQFMQTHDVASIAPELMLGALGGFIVALVTIFKQTWAPVTAPIYALLEGLVLGGLSALFEMRYPGIALEAVGLTFGTLFVMLFLYKSGVIKVTQKFRMGVVAATFGIAIFYGLVWLLSMFHITLFASVFASGAIGIGFSLFVVTIAALNLVLDFDFVEQGVTVGAPKYMEWYAAFGIMVTLVWLYLEMLRLLAKMRRN
ncbi:MAG: Bax inhibitor-1/YccA family protein [Terracidiphilus sp.]|nr:Bax inhibitor-1/YccA family protein [Terracidiphilus sp.]MDR3798656.1 Bax inhibitor-1/YccA family protein [Terracidiphilus sp.]